MDWICLECGHIFDEGEGLPVKEFHPEIPGGHYEEFLACPSCGSDQIERAVHCKKCGGSFLPDDLYGGYYCRECMEEYLLSSAVVDYAEDDMENFAEFINEREGKKLKPDEMAIATLKELTRKMERTADEAAAILKKLTEIRKRSEEIEVIVDECLRLIGEE